MMSFMFSPQSIELWYRSENVLTGLILKIPVNMREYFRLTDFRSTLYIKCWIQLSSEFYILKIEMPYWADCHSQMAVYHQSVRLGAKPLEAHDQRYFFSTESLRKSFLCNILSDERMRLSLMNMLGLCQGYVSHIQHIIENVCFCTTFKSSVRTVFEGQVMAILLILCYNGSLVTWTVGCY
jgi:hypothetical protein